MLGNFSYCNPTKLHFGRRLWMPWPVSWPTNGKRVQLIYGGGSIKKNGIYDQVVSILKAAGKEIFEDPGVMPNPTTEKLYEGCKIARENNVDLLLGGGGRLLLRLCQGRVRLRLVRRDPGRNTMSAWRSLPTASFPWAVC